MFKRDTQRILLLSLCGATSVVGCVDVKARFDDFGRRVTDADTSRIDGADLGEIPDISGEFYLALSPSIAPDLLLRFVVDNELMGGDAPSIRQTFQPLCVAEICTPAERLRPVGDPLLAENMPINGAGEFEVSFVQVMVSGKANPISGSDIVADLQIHAQIKTADLFCGTVDGTALAAGTPVPLAGSTFGAIRIVPGTLGDDLPEPVTECPAAPPDAGVADAGSDASVADAGADAAATDAGIDAAL